MQHVPINHSSFFKLINWNSISIQRGISPIHRHPPIFFQLDERKILEQKKLLRSRYIFFKKYIYINEWCRDTVLPLKFVLPSLFHLPSPSTPLHSHVFSYFHFPFLFVVFPLHFTTPSPFISFPLLAPFPRRFLPAVGKIFVDAGTPSPIRPNFTNIRGRINAASLNDDVSPLPPSFPSSSLHAFILYETKMVGHSQPRSIHVCSRFHFISISVIFDARYVSISYR